MRKEIGQVFLLLALLIPQIVPLIAEANTIRYTADMLADAIFWAEGGHFAKKPYGILSVECNSEADCRRVCLNTIRNNYQRFLKQKRYDEYLEFLASRYAPIGAENDRGNLNVNWLKNVKYYLRNPKEVR